jgi:hypothetical protein
MAIDQVWTSPVEGGAIDLDANQQFTEVVYDKILSNINRIGGSSGPPNAATGRGVFPLSGYIMGGLAFDLHVEGGTTTVSGTAGRNGYRDITFTNSFATTPLSVTVTVVTSSTGVAWGEHGISNIASGGFRLHNYTAAAAAITYTWLALGSDG